MSPLLIALLGILFIPLFVATWRTSLFGLACQGLLMAVIAYRLSPEPSVGHIVTLLDLALVRGVFAPYVLYRVQRARNAPARNDVIAPNLLSWTIALGMALMSFSFAEALVVEPGDTRTLVAVATAGLLLGFLVLASRSGPFGQMVGVLRLENAIALLELSGAQHETPLELQVGLIVVFMITVGFFSWYLANLDAPAAVDPAAEAPTL